MLGGDPSGPASPPPLPCDGALETGAFELGFDGYDTALEDNELKVLGPELDALVAEHAGSKSIVVDFSNTFCGPCKIMYPKFEALSERFADGALFYSCSLDESAEASTLGKREAVQIVPSFIIWKDGARLEAVEGLKPDLLVAAVSRAAETSFWAAPLGRARRKVAKFGLLGAFRKLLRNGRRRLVRAFRR